MSTDSDPPVTVLSGQSNMQTPCLLTKSEKSTVWKNSVVIRKNMSEKQQKVLTEEEIIKKVGYAGDLIFIKLKTHQQVKDWVRSGEMKEDRRVYIMWEKGYFMGRGRYGKPIPTFNYRLTEIDAETGETFALRLTQEDLFPNHENI